MRSFCAKMAAAMVLAASSSARAGLIVTLDEFTGSDLRVRLTFSELTGPDAGKIGLLAEVVTDPLFPNVGDLRGVFMNFSADSGPLFSGLTVTGPDVTDFEFHANSVTSTGGDNNINPGGPFDIGVELGSPGIGSNDIHSTSMVFASSGPLTLDNFPVPAWNFGARATSVGQPDGSRSGSSKLLGTGFFIPLPQPDPVDPQSSPMKPEPATAALVLLGLMIATFGRQTRQSRGAS